MKITETFERNYNEIKRKFQNNLRVDVNEMFEGNTMGNLSRILRKCLRNLKEILGTFEEISAKLGENFEEIMRKL